MRIQRYKVLAYRRNRYEKDQSAFIRSYPDRNCFARRYAAVADLYVMELEAYVPNEIIDEYTYEQVFRQVLSLVEETFRPDHFDSSFPALAGTLVHWLDFNFMEWLISRQGELKRRLTWSQVCELQCNWMGWNLIRMLIPDFPEKTIKEMWYYSDEKQKEDLHDRT